jgi:hypothetical protein
LARQCGRKWFWKNEQKNVGKIGQHWTLHICLRGNNKNKHFYSAKNGDPI